MKLLYATITALSGYFTTVELTSEWHPHIDTSRYMIYMFLFAFPRPFSDVKEMDPLTSWKIVSPCPMLRCGCCCWARRCFCLADWRHMVIISVHASIFDKTLESHLSFSGETGRLRRAEVKVGGRCSVSRGGRSAGVTDPKWSHPGGDSEELWNFVGAELTAPPAGPVLIGPHSPCTLPPVCFPMFTFFMIGACR